MTPDKVDAMGEKKNDEHFQRVLNRPYYYAYSAGGKTIYAYTEEEWGLGASSGGGDHNLIRSFYFSLFLTVLVAPVSLFCLGLGVLALFSPTPIMALVMVFFGLLFGLAVVQGYFNIAEEWRGRKARKLKGLPKPWWEADDDCAYEWFLKYPDHRIQMTLEYFPYSVKLRKEHEERPAQR
jgi:hypothetical protein